MPTYSRLTINLSPSEEKQIKQTAKEQGKSISMYCRVTLLGNTEQPLSRASIESEIDKLKNEITRMNHNIMSLSKILLKQSKLNSELSNAFLLLALNGDEEQQLEIYQNAESEAETLIRKIFT